MSIKLLGTQYAGCLIAFSIFCAATGLAEGNLSQNYKQTISLPRGEEAFYPSQAELQAIVARHNQPLVENPAAKNRNRIVYPDGPLRYKEVLFAAAPNTRVVDGAGKLMGNLAADHPEVMINFGQHKDIDGSDHIMVFAAPTVRSGPVTGWIAASALLPSPEKLQFAAVLAMNVANTAEGGDAPQKYRVSCGSPKAFDEGRIKILPNVDDRKNRHEAASDYVERPGGFCYLLTSLPRHGGVATDTLSSGAEFIPSAGMPRVEVPLYLPVDVTAAEQTAWSENRLPHTMEFRYGRVGTRYGWIAAVDLQREP